MKFDHLVRHDGKDYQAGMDVPVELRAKVPEEAKVPEGAEDNNSDGSDETEPVAGSVDIPDVENLESQVGEPLKDEKPKKNSKAAAGQE